MPDEQYRKEQQEQRQKNDAAFANMFKLRREEFDQLQKRRQADEAKHLRQEAIARQKPSSALSDLFDYEVDMEEAARRTQLNEEKLKFVRERYPTLDKWLALGKRGAMLEKVPGGAKIQRALELLPDRLKGAVKELKEGVGGETKMPGFLPWTTKEGLRALTDPESSAEEKRRGWGWLVRGLSGIPKGIVSYGKRAKSQASRGFDQWQKDRALFGLYPGLEKGIIAPGLNTGMADEAKWNYQRKKKADERSPYVVKDEA